MMVGGSPFFWAPLVSLWMGAFVARATRLPSRSRDPRRSRELKLSLCPLYLSLALIAALLALFVPGPGFSLNPDLVAFAAILSLAFALGLRFPRAAGLPLFLVAILLFGARGVAASGWAPLRPDAQPSRLSVAERPRAGPQGKAIPLGRLRVLSLSPGGALIEVEDGADGRVALEMHGDIAKNGIRVGVDLLSLPPWLAALGPTELRSLLGVASGSGGIGASRAGSLGAEGASPEGWAIWSEGAARGLMAGLGARWSRVGAELRPESAPLSYDLGLLGGDLVLLPVGAQVAKHQ
jgi:hypothetical protein